MRNFIKAIAILYIVLGVSYLSYNLLFSKLNFNPNFILENSTKNYNSYEYSQLISKTSNNKISEQNTKYFCGNNVSSSNYYIEELSIPVPCSQPVGLTIDKEHKIWIGSAYKESIIVFDPLSKKFVKTITIPDFSSNIHSRSMIWDLRFDKNGDLWFTDRYSNSIWKYFLKENKFERYLVPTKNSYPISLVFDSEGRIWFSEVFGKKLGMVDTHVVKNNTSNGIKEYYLPNNIDFETLGPLTIKKDSNSNKERLWLSTINFPYNGEIIKFDITSKNFTVYNLGKNKILPISVTEDENGTLWTNDHASNIFLSFNPSTGFIKKFSTSPPNTRNTTSSLPYYNIYKDGKLWFNEHEGNAIASYDPKSNTLIEFHIPTRNPLWGNTSNPLKFAIDDNNIIWFTEWTENKLGQIEKDRTSKIPIELNLSKNKMILDTNNDSKDTIDISIQNAKQNKYHYFKENTDNDFQNKFANVSIFISSSITQSGKMTNLSYLLGKQHFESFDTHRIEPVKTKLEIFSNVTSQQVEVGNYTLTVSVRYDNEITISKIIDLEIK